MRPGFLRGGKSEPEARAKPGTGKRFSALKQKLAGKGVKDPGALAASLSRAKYGKKKMSKMASKGRKK